MNFFLHSDGVTDSLRRSIYVAVLTIVACLGIGTPAGYALARFASGRPTRSGSRS